ncbi:MAG: zinc-dependent alcohol dehydrogenase family protein [bacterium]|nr:MAG: zinc-dependent alcohol dehydrogenase family protein [bacterium]
MRAMLLEKPGPVSSSPLRRAEVPEPAPGPGEVAVRVSACGVCHTDLHTVEGDMPLPRLPVIPGHQVTGTVEAAGEGARRFRAGQRVGIAWLGSTCGACTFCRSGRENLCREARFTGYHRDGGYAERVLVPESFAYALPDGFSDIQAAPLLCAGIIGFRSLRLSGIKPGGRLGLYGFGASAHVAIQVARHWGCEVYVFSRGREHRALAEDLGAAWTGRVPESPPVPLDSSIIFAPAGELVPEALTHLDRGGTLALAGIHMSPVPRLDYAKHLYYEKTVRSVTASTRADGEDLLALASAIPISTHATQFPLAEANHALQELKAGRISGAAVLVP